MVTFGTVVRCTNEATISSTEGAVGGITGQLCGIISACVNKGAISSTKLSVGGICGQSFTHNVVEGETIIENCYNTGAITAHSAVERVGRYLRKRF